MHNTLEVQHIENHIKAAPSAKPTLFSTMQDEGQLYSSYIPPISGSDNIYTSPAVKGHMLPHSTHTLRARVLDLSVPQGTCRRGAESISNQPNM